MTQAHKNADWLAQAADLLKADADEAESREAAQRAFDAIKAAREQRALKKPRKPQ